MSFAKWGSSGRRGAAQWTCWGSLLARSTRRRLATMADPLLRVLAVEDDPSLSEVLAINLREEGFDVTVRPSADGIEDVIRDFDPDIAIIDVNLGPGPDGFSIARQLRTAGDTPIIMLTAADTLDDRLTGFSAGCDDYIAKPFSMAEVIARVRALLRRSGRLETRVLRIDDIEIDEGGRTVTRSGAKLELTRTEFDLLLALAANQGRVLSKTQLLAQVWEFDEYDSNLVEVYVSNLRRKLEERGPRVIQTVRGIGYVLRSEP